MSAKVGPGKRTVMVRQMTWEAENVISLLLAQPDGHELPAWTPGAHIDAAWPNGVTRQYSLCSEPDDRTHYRIAILREEVSRGGSWYAHDTLRVGDLITISDPLNHFEFLPGTASLFIAGGIGITPILPMVREAAQSGATWELLYGGRRRSSMAFLDELARYGDRVVVRPQDEFGLLDLDTWLGEPQPGTHVYCCGPEPLLAAVEQRCATWHADALRVERFAPKPRILDAEGAELPFRVTCARSALEVEVQPGETIMEVLRAGGVSVPSSCEEGICGTCETAILDGVADHRDSVLSSVEQAEGKTMMLCVSRAKTDTLVLDI